MDDKLLKRTLFAILAPYIKDYDNYHQSDDFFDNEEDGQISMDDLRFLCNMTTQCLKDDKQYSTENILTILKTFWYICDSVLPMNLLSSDLCRETILLSMDSCNAHAICHHTELKYYEPFTQLSGLLGYIYDKILSFGKRDKSVIISDDEIIHYETAMKNLTSDYFLPRLEKYQSSLYHHLNWWKWDILDKIEVWFHPSPALLSLLIRFGSKPHHIMKESEVEQTTIDILYNRFLSRIGDASHRVMGQEERQDIEDCVNKLYDMGERSTVPRAVIFEDIQILGYDNGDSSSMGSESDSGNDDED